MLIVKDIERMSIVERPRDDRTSLDVYFTETSVPSPTWHGDILQARKAKVDAGEGHFLSLEELKKRLRR